MQGPGGLSLLESTTAAQRRVSACCDPRTVLMRSRTLRARRSAAVECFEEQRLGLAQYGAQSTEVHVTRLRACT